jgi:AraC-like DNA-binding protein
VVRTVQRHIDAIHGREVTVQSVARLAGYSPYHFLRLFKRHAGCTVHEYVNRARRRRVGELLARGWSQKAIGADLGFSGPASFSRWWKRQRQRDGGDDHPAPGAPLSPD